MDDYNINKQNINVMERFYRETIGLLKRRISIGKTDADRVSALLIGLGKEIDRRKVYDEPAEELETLYEDALWIATVGDGEGDVI